MNKAASREVFLKGMDLMMDVKKAIMKKRDLVAKGKEVIEANQSSEDLEDLQNFYAHQIFQAQQEISKAKEIALCFINTNKQEHSDGMAILEKEYADLPE